MDHIHGDAQTHGSEGAARSDAHIRAGTADTRDGDDSTLHVLGDIARGGTANALYASTNRVRETVQSMNQRTRIFSIAREKPLTALGVALGAGFLLAIATESGEGNRHVERLRRRLKAALISGIAAAIASATPAITGPGGMVDELGDWLEGRNSDGPDDWEYDDEDEYDDEPEY